MMSTDSSVTGYYSLGERQLAEAVKHMVQLQRFCNTAKFSAVPVRERTPSASLVKCPANTRGTSGETSGRHLLPHVGRLAQCACPTPGVNPLPSAPTHFPSRTAPFLSELVKRPASKMHLLYISELFSIYPAEAIDWPSARYRNTRFARLNCLFGRAVAEKSHTKSRLDMAYTWAAPMVYQLLNYTWYGNWGPFEDDEKGKVDWTRVEASMVLLGHNTADGPYELGYMMKAPPFSG